MSRQDDRPSEYTWMLTGTTVGSDNPDLMTGDAFSSDSVFDIFQRNDAYTRTPGKEEKKRSGGLIEQLLSYRLFVITWVSMFLAVLSGSAIGPIFKFMENHGVEPLIAASWRNQSMLVFLIPAAILERHLQNPVQRKQCELFIRRPELRFPVYVHVLIAGLFWTISMLSWTMALQYTTTVRASILASLHTLFLVLIIHVSGGRVSSYEWAGVLVVMVGVVVIGSDGLFDPTPQHVPLEYVLFGDGLCLLSSFSQSVIILNRNQTKQFVAVMQYTALTTGMIVLLGSVAAVLFENATVNVFKGTWDDRALLGWLNDEWRETVVCFGLVVGVVCIAGFNYASGHIAPLVFSAFTLLDPALTGVISWVAGLEAAPDLTVWIGGVVVLLGVGLLTYGEHVRDSASIKGYRDVKVEEDEEEGAIRLRELQHTQGVLTEEELAAGMRRRSSSAAVPVNTNTHSRAPLMSSALSEAFSPIVEGVAAAGTSPAAVGRSLPCDSRTSPLPPVAAAHPSASYEHSPPPSGCPPSRSRSLLSPISSPTAVPSHNASWLAPVEESKEMAAHD